MSGSIEETKPYAKVKNRVDRPTKELALGPPIGPGNSPASQFVRNRATSAIMKNEEPGFRSLE